MKIVRTLLLAIVSVIILAWFGFFFYFHDFSVPTVSTDKYKKILIVFPHPDDELLSAGGLMKINKNATLLILTKGERGNPDAHLDPNLKVIRTKEERASSRILGVKKLIQKDYGDNTLQNKKDEIKKEIETTIKNEKPNLIITFDESGFTGHPDHIVVSEATTELIKTEFKDIPLWYATASKRVYNFIGVPENLVTDKNFYKRRTYPTLKVFVGGTIFNKVISTIAQKSQYSFFEGGFPIPIPSAFFDSMAVYEYFYRAN